MTQLNTTPTERARKAFALVLRKLQGHQADIAKSMGESESKISRAKNEDFQFMVEVLCHAGLKIVPVEYQCYPEAQINMMFSQWKAQVHRAQSPSDFFPPDDDPE